MRGMIKKEGSSCYVVYDAPRDSLTGKRKQRKRRFKTKKEAKKFLSEQLKPIDKGTYFEPSDLTFSEYFDYWLENYVKANTAPKTIEGYTTIITQHLTRLWKHKNSKLQPSHLQEYYVQILRNGKLDGGGLSAQSVKHQHRLISNALKDVVKWQIIVL